MTDTDRRRYFRINERLGIAYRVLGDEEESGSGEPPVDIYTLLSRYDRDITQLLGQLPSRDGPLRDLLDTLNKKINCIANQLELESRMIEQIAHRVAEVNISACGMAATLDEALAPGTRLELDLVLLPENQRLVARAVVVSSEPRTDGEGHYTRLAFSELDTGNQERLIQHIVRRQSELLRLKRERDTPL